MKKIFIALLVLLGLLSCRPASEYQPQNGDIIFHASQSSQSLAIQKATKSQYSHMGIIFLQNGTPFVFEAVGPVKFTPLRDWVARGNGKHYVVKRLANAQEVITKEAANRMVEVGELFEGKPYDLYFEWSDNRVYCSELVWKIYKQALNLEIGELQTMAEFDLTDPLVQKKIRERFGDSVPKDEKVISPAAIFASNLLIEVHKE
ncbi:MAG: YiiX family permuted papain-like enzyme [Deltaproteobacteria bacterium]|nr:YiiX family permuted papain-like enzyme [Deltaproteobacteria bacterium]